MKNYQNKTKILKVSTVLRAILFAGLVLWAIGIPEVVFQSIMYWTRPATVAAWTALCLQGSLVLSLVFRFMVTLHLFRFFDRLKKGSLFDAKTVGHLDAAGKWWIILWPFEVLHQELGHAINDLPGAWAWDCGGLFAGLTLVFVAWLLKEAQELQEEQELTV
jgi:Protein of unknown function (DUF2975)